MQKDVYPVLGNMPLTDVKPIDILKLCDRIKSRGAPKMALLMRNVLRRMYDFATARQLAETNPAAALVARFIATEASRIRVLSLLRSANEVFPFIAAQYRADMARKVFVGHLYSNLLGLELLLTRPATFEHYILGRPSLWFDRGVMFEREKAYAGTQRDMPASTSVSADARPWRPARSARVRRKMPTWSPT
jgi:hypothetical protein